MTFWKLKPCTVLILSFFLLAASPGNSATLRGHLYDSKTKEALIGAIIYNKDDKKIHDAAGLDGSYTIKNLPPGTYTFEIEYIGYIKQEKTITVKDPAETINQNFLLEVQSVNLGETTIVAKQDKESDTYARDLEKNSESVINILSAKTILLLPDITVGDVLQRVSGVTVEKTASGAGRYTVIRGMDKRYNYTTIDGIKIPSPDPDNRYVPMDIFPSEILQRLEVIKSLTPSMEGDATGGVINLKLKDAPDHFILDANAATGYNQTLFDRSFTDFNTSVINEKSPQQLHGSDYAATLSDFPMQNYEYKHVAAPPNLFGGFTVGDRFLNNKLGVLISANYQDTYTGSSSFFLKPSAAPDATNRPIFDDIEYRTYSLHQQRSALHAKLDYEFNRKHKISFYSVYVSLDQERERHFYDITGTSSTSNASQIEYHDESKVTQQNIYNSTLHGEDSIVHNLLLDWSAAYSLAGSNTPDWGTLVSTSNSLGEQGWKSFDRKWLQNTDQDISAYINLTYGLNVLGEKIELKAGAMNRDKSRDNSFNDYSLNFVSPQLAGPIQNAQFTNVSTSTGTPPSDPNNYSIQEDVTAYYGQAKFMIGQKIQVLGGYRFENTAQAYVTQEPISIPGKTGSKQYYDLLPSLHLKYIINEKQAIRASYFASITRPGYFEIVPYTITGEYFDTEGNPYLKHSTADNYDLRYEYFPKPSEQILAGVFYKQIYNPIETGFDRLPDSPSALYVKPQNFGDATNYGFEFVISKYIKHFGVSANYTYTQSQITTTKLLYYVDPSSNNPDKSKYVDQTRPLQGQANNIANLSFIYKNPDIGLDVLLSAVYTGKLISIVSLYYDLDYWQMPMTRLDFSFEKKLSKKYNLSLYGKVNNLLNTALVLRQLQPNFIAPDGSYYYPEQDNKNNILVEKELYGQTYMMGIRHKF